MGNAQSHGEPHHRLVKPKTNTNSPSIISENDRYMDSPASLSSRYASLSTRDRQQIKSQLLSPVRTDFEHRGSFEEEKRPEEVDVQRRFSFRTNSLSRFRKKAGSTARLSSLPTSKVSLVQGSQAVDLETAISILQEVQKNATPEDLAALRQALEPYAPSPSPRPSSVNEPGLSRRTSLVDRSTSSLTRRRSLLATPGLATRDSPVESNRRTWSSWRTPKLDAQEEAKWQRHDMVESSSLARVAAIDLTKEGRKPPELRPQTPSDMEYSHIGTLKLGSLKIANGEPSPANSARLNWSASQATSQGEDYPSDALDSPVMMKSTRKRHHVRSKSALQSPTSPLYRNLRVSNDSRRAKTTSRYDAPPKSEASKQSRQQLHSYHLPYEELDEEPEPIRRLRVMNKSQETLATMLSQPGICDEASEFPPSVPFEDYDEAFASDEDVPREETAQILNGTIFSEPVEAADLQEHIVPYAVSTPKGLRKVKSRPPPTKADSGYSSGGSFKTKHREACKPSTIPTGSREASVVADSRKSEDGTAKDNPSFLHTVEPFPQAPISHNSPSSDPTDEHVMLTKIHRYQSHEEMKHDPLPSDWNIDDLSLGTNAPKSPSTPTSFISHFSLDNNASTQRRLQKKNSSSQARPVVQSCDPIPEGSIPGIPTDIRKQFVRRLSEAPGMECLTRTYPTKNHVNNDEPELEPELPYLEPITFPSPPAMPEPETRGRYHEPSGKERSSSFHRLRRNLSLFRRKTKKDEEEQPPLSGAPTISDLGTTAASIGRSPHDVSLATAQQKRASSPAHPHKIGNALPRAKSMVNMDAETAAKLARFRSNDRTSMRPQMPSRPNSYYSEKEAASETDLYRRHSLYGHAPPMPTIRSIGELHAVSREYEQKTLIQPEIPQVQQVSQVPEPIEANFGRKIRANKTGRGRVVTPLIEKYEEQGSQRPSLAERRLRSSTVGNDGTYCAALLESHAYRSVSDAVPRRFEKQVKHPDWG